jgi:hypothetical protein
MRGRAALAREAIKFYKQVRKVWLPALKLLKGP